MKTLFILRHAKAEPDAGKHPDHARLLNDRGHRDAQRTGRWLQEKHYQPQRILCSSARRTMQTLEEIQPFLPQESSVCYDDELYLASAGTLLYCLQTLEERWTSVLLIGHNPGLQQLIHLLLASIPPQRAESLQHLPTCGLAILQLQNTPWADLQPATATLLDVLSPKDYL